MQPCQIKTEQCMGGSLVDTSPRYISSYFATSSQFPLENIYYFAESPSIAQVFVYPSANQYRNAVPASQGSYETPLILIMSFKIIK